MGQASVSLALTVQDRPYGNVHRVLAMGVRCNTRAQRIQRTHLGTPPPSPTSSWRALGVTFARESQSRAPTSAQGKQARSARQGAEASGIESLPPGQARRHRRLDAQHQSPTRPPSRGTPKICRCHMFSSLSVVKRSSVAQ